MLLAAVWAWCMRNCNEAGTYPHIADPARIHFRRQLRHATCASGAIRRKRPIREAPLRLQCLQMHPCLMLKCCMGHLTSTPVQCVQPTTPETVSSEGMQSKNAIEEMLRLTPIGRILAKGNSRRTHAAHLGRVNAQLRGFNCHHTLEGVRQGDCHAADPAPEVQRHLHALRLRTSTQPTSCIVSGRVSAGTAGLFTQNYHQSIVHYALRETRTVSPCSPLKSVSAPQCRSTCRASCGAKDAFASAIACSKQISCVTEQLI